MISFVENDSETDRVELLLQCMDLRLDLLQESLHSPIDADGTTGRL